MMVMVKVSVDESLSRWIKAVGRDGRRNLYSAASASVCSLTRQHIGALSIRRHFTAQRLGATPTWHLEKAARTTVFSADANHGEVVIPSPGFGRAFHDVTIVPRETEWLTLPLHAAAYGKRAVEVRSLGWMLFRPPEKGAKLTTAKGEKPRRYSAYKNLIMGVKDSEVTTLYLLKKQVHQRQDRSLLPSDRDMRMTASRAMMGEILRVAKKGSK